MNLGTAAFGRGIISKEESVTDMIERTEADIIHLHEVDTENFERYESYNIEGYLQFASRPTRVGKKRIMKTRTISLVKTDSVVDATQITQDGAARSEVWLKVTLKNMTEVIITGCYAEWDEGRAGRDEAGFHRMLAKHEGKNILVLGDFNRCLQKARNEEGSRNAKFVEDLEHLGYTILEAGPTFCRTVEGKVIQSWLDWGITNMPDLKLHKTWHTFSDHASVWLYMEGKSPRDDEYRPIQSKNKLYSDNSIRTLQEEVESNWELLTRGDIEERAAAMDKLLVDHKREAAPVKLVKIGERPKPHQHPKLSSIRRAINKARRDERHECLKKLKNKYRNELKKVKKKGVQKTLEGGGPDALWKLYRKHTGEPRAKPRIVNDGKIMSDQEAANAFLSFFYNKVAKLRERANPDGRLPAYEGQEISTRFSFRHVSEQEVRKIILNMKNTDAQDHLGTTQTDLKHLMGPLLHPLTKLVNDSLSEGVFPRGWKKARIVPVLKGGKPARETSSYRPLSMLVPMSKVLEQVVKIQLQEHATIEGFIPPSQHGYQRGRSIETAVAEALNIVDQKRRKGKKCAIVCFDFSAAFDLIDAELLQKKLDRLGCDETSKKWISSYLENRQIYVDVGGHRSETVTMTFGSPQGSCLSPLLFLLLIHEMEQSLPGRLISYADDSTNIVWGNTKQEVKDKIRESVASMVNYASMCGLSLNVDKTEIMYLGRRPLGELKINDKLVQEKKQIKFLGVHMSKTLDMKTHIDVVMSDLNTKLGVMRRLRKIMPKENRILIAKSVILGKIRSFMNTALDPVFRKGKEQIKRLQRVWNAASRTALGIHPKSRIPTEDLMDGMGVDNIRKTCTLTALKFAYDVMKEDGPKHFLADLGEEDKRAERTRRLQYENSGFESADGRSSVMKSRGLWNALESAGLSYIKASPSPDIFMDHCRAQYNKIEEELRKRWIWETTHH